MKLLVPVFSSGSGIIGSISDFFFASSLRSFFKVDYLSTSYGVVLGL